MTKTGDRVEPPPAEKGVPERAEENGACEIGAEHVLGSLAASGDGAELVREAPLSDTEFLSPRLRRALGRELWVFVRRGASAAAYT
jgi:hypothetical protein